MFGLTTMGEAQTVRCRGRRNRRFFSWGITISRPQTVGGAEVSCERDGILMGFWCIAADPSLVRLREDAFRM